MKGANVYLKQSEMKTIWVAIDLIEDEYPKEKEKLGVIKAKLKKRIVEDRI